MLMFILITSTVTGALFYRIRGSNSPDWPRPVKQAMFCIVFDAVMLVLGVPLIVCLPVYVLSVIATLLGHGQYFLEVQNKYQEPESLDFIVKLFWGKDPRYNKLYSAAFEHEDIGYGYDYVDAVHNRAVGDIAQDIRNYGVKKLYFRCLTGLAVTGFMVSLAPGLAVIFTTDFKIAGIMLALSGLVSKPLAYLCSNKLGYSTEPAEWGTGGLQWFLASSIAMASY